MPPLPIPPAPTGSWGPPPASNVPHWGPPPAPPAPPAPTGSWGPPPAPPVSTPWGPPSAPVSWGPRSWEIPPSVAECTTTATTTTLTRTRTTTTTTKGNPTTKAAVKRDSGWMTATWLQPTGVPTCPPSIPKWQPTPISTSSPGKPDVPQQTRRKWTPRSIPVHLTYSYAPVAATTTKSLPSMVSAEPIYYTPTDVVIPSNSTTRSGGLHYGTPGPQTLWDVAEEMNTLRTVVTSRKMLVTRATTTYTNAEATADAS
ncbi:hypothetical protein F4810DRAFT_706048 [Camillea tinctor]|nr:hypothetical protein F4810DRAFT_706048 [Camillea tinctor]